MIALFRLWLTRRRARRLAARTTDRIMAGSMVERARQWEGATYE